MRRRDHEVVAQLSDLARFSFFLSVLLSFSILSSSSTQFIVVCSLLSIASRCRHAHFSPVASLFLQLIVTFFFVGSVFPISHTTHQFPTASAWGERRMELGRREEKSSLQLPRLVVMNSGAADEERKKNIRTKKKKVVCYSLLDCAVWLSYEYRVRYSLFHDENSAKQQVSLHNT